MSAWPEAVWIIRETQKALNMEGRLIELAQRLKIIENRFFFISTTAPVLPDPSDPYGIGEGSLWLKVEPERGQ